MREAAERKGKTLSTVDVEVDGTRFTGQGVARKAEASFLLWAGIAARKLSAKRLNELRDQLRAELRPKEREGGR